MKKVKSLKNAKIVKSAQKHKNKIIFAGLGLFCAFMLIGLLLPLMTNLNSAKLALQEELTKKFNYPVEIKSDISYSLLPRGKVYINDVALKDFTIKKISISASWIEILSGKVDLKNMQIESDSMNNMDLEQYISILKDFNEFYLSMNSFYLNGEEYRNFEIQISTKDNVKTFVIVFKKQGKNYQINGELTQNSENQMRVFIESGNDNKFESIGFFNIEPFVYYANYKAKSNQMGIYTNDILDDGNYEMQGQLRYSKDGLKFIKSNINGPKIKANFTGNLSQKDGNLNILSSELSVQSLNLIEKLSKFSENKNLTLFVMEMQIDNSFGELNLNKENEKITFTYSADSNVIKGDISKKGNIVYKVGNVNETINIDFDMQNKKVMFDKSLGKDFESGVKTLFKNFDVEIKKPKAETLEEKKTPIKTSSTDNKKIVEKLSFLLLPVQQYEVVSDKTLTKIKSDFQSITLKKTQTDIYEIEYSCDDAKACLQSKYLQNSLPLSFSGTLRFFENGYEISQIKGNLNSDIFSGVINNQNISLNFETFNYHKNIDESKISLDIYLEKPNFINDIFNETKDINLKIASLSINNQNLPNIDIFYKNYSLKIQSPNLDFYLRKDIDISGYIKAKSLPIYARFFENSPIDLKLNICDIDAIFVSPSSRDFSSLFFNLKSDFKFSCIDSKNLGFNFISAIKSVYYLSSISIDNVSNAITSNLTKLSTEKSNILLQGQINQGQAVITKFTSQNKYGVLDLTGSAEFLKKRFSTKGTISLNYLSQSPITIQYQNEGSIYKNNPRYDLQDILKIQKYYLDANRTKMKFN